MDLRQRPYKGKRPQLGKRVYVDPCATLMGDIERGDNA
ncbi:carbonic anhydrase/acetyltransferase-like protein (isoleucine patch superfamily) [Aeromonas veronii]|nr:carbonic anhydrase/acetyltransferase-like protein (isoleucine patch superfamily) [Aeromonas veronii]